MKKNTVFYPILFYMMIFLCALCLSGCSSKTSGDNSAPETTVAEYNVTIKVNFTPNIIFNRYDVDLLIDKEKGGSLKHGENGEFSFRLKEGKHTITFSNASSSKITGEKSLTVNKDLEASYQISCEGNYVEVKELSVYGVMDAAPSESARESSEKSETKESDISEEPPVLAASESSSEEGSMENPGQSQPASTEDNSVFPESTGETTAPETNAPSSAPSPDSYMTQKGSTVFKGIIANEKFTKIFEEAGDTEWYTRDADIDGVALQVASAGKDGQVFCIKLMDLMQTGRTDLYYKALNTVFTGEDLEEATAWLKENLGKETSAKIKDANLVLYLTTAGYPIFYIIDDEHLDWI